MFYSLWLYNRNLQGSTSQPISEQSRAPPPPPDAPSHLHDVGVGVALRGLAVLRVAEQRAVHVAAGVLEQLVGAADDDDGDVAVAQDAQLVRLLHQTEPPLGEGHLTDTAGRTERLTWALYAGSLGPLLGVIPGVLPGHPR